jgi:hemerythrin-like domain-containing protein
MMSDHAQIEALLEDVMAAFKSGDGDLATQAYTRLEKRLLTHLAFEDAQLLPVLERSDPEAAAALAAEHARFRARLYELGVGVELHYTRATAIAELVEMLRDHARREDAILYPHAEEAGVEHAPADDQC